MENHLKSIDNVLRNHLQKTICLYINNKLIKTGKFILYNFHDYHIELAIIHNNKIKKTFLPVPFALEHYEEDDLLFFDYRVKTLFAQFTPGIHENKYYNNILEIQFK